MQDLFSSLTSRFHSWGTAILKRKIDYYWEKLSAVPESEQCCWLEDKYGLSWQIVPTVLDEMLKDKDEKKIARVTEAFLKMKKFDIRELKEAYYAKSFPS